MKKILSIMLIIVMLSLSACSAKNPNTASPGTPETTADPTVANIPESYAAEAATEASETTPTEIVQLPLPEETAEFSFLSGAGAWRTVMTLNRDGTFTGWYLDSEMGEIGKGYPHGSAYTCTFSGKFKNIE